MLVEKFRPAVLCLSETHVDKEVYDKELKINGYKLEKCLTHNRRTGGVLVYIKKEFQFKKIINEVQGNYIWMLGIEIKIRNKIYQLITIYHPPQTNDNLFLEYVDNFLDDIECKGVVIIVGDFNIDYSKDTFYKRKIKDIIYQYGLYQLVNSPTRITKTSSTIIDYIITNEKELNYENWLTPKISDHNILKINTNTKHYNDTKNYVVRKSRMMKGYNTDEFQEKIIKTEWNRDETNVNIMSDKLVTDIINVVNEIAPIKEIKIYHDKQENEWIDSVIKENINSRNNLYKKAVLTGNEQDWEEYKQKRNCVTSMIRRNKEEFYKNAIRNKKGTELWKELKKMLPEKSEKICDNIIFDGILETKESSIAEKFNLYFIESIDSIIRSINIQRNNYVQGCEENISTFEEFEKITMKQLREIIYALKETTDPEYMISMKVVKDAFEVIGDRFLDMVNTSLTYGIFPSAWKTSYVIPVPKVSNSSKCEDHRPINTVSVFEKIIEVAVKDQLINFCDNKEVIVQNQSGFRKHYSCESAIINVCDEWFKCLEDNEVVLVIFLDLKRAFETISRELLISKLEGIGLRNNVLNWFKSYLSNRCQKVKYNNSVTGELQIEHGVPQGTILGPILFTLYINDIVKCVQECKISMFADDTILYISGKDLNQMYVSINRELNILNNWLCHNSLSLNLTKTKYMLIGKNYTLSSLDTTNFYVELNNYKIEQVKEIKYLGVIIDENLKFKKHCEYILNKMSKKVNFMRRIGGNLTMSTKILLYKAIISPHIEYCSSILFNFNQNEIEKLQKLQNKSMRTILKCNRYTPIKTMLEVLNFMNVKQRIIFKTLDFVYKLKNKTTAPYLSNKVKYVNNVHSHNTRQKNDFFIDTAKTSLLNKTILYKGLNMFNTLPTEIKNCETYSKFKKMLKNHVVNTYVQS